MSRQSDKLANVDMEEITLKGRARLRMNLDIACEERDIVKRRLDFIEEWKEGVRNEQVGRDKTKI